ncbi:UNVERIFIED_CONTAM: protein INAPERTURATE POLLEN1 [Sesamum radiatum]|uniref:Protein INAPERTURATE POLLEN1 n=1 Tax=Sesamum radiatum TaxID=300843 RepID=A0AAW2L0P3_SESRA
MFRSPLFGRKKTTTRPFAHFYNDWSTTLATTLLPQLRRALSSFPASPAVLSTHVDAVYNHFHAYYTALDQAAAADVSQCLYPEWRNSLEKPFLWLGDLHPYLFTNLLRSFLEDQESSQDENDDFGYDVASAKESLHTSWHVAAAWRSPSRALTARVDQIACGLRLMVPALAARARHAQAKLGRNVGAEWGRKEGVLKAAAAEAMAAEMEELVGSGGGRQQAAEERSGRRSERDECVSGGAVPGSSGPILGWVSG